MFQPRFTDAQLQALAADDLFQKRIAEDDELNRLFNPALSDHEVRQESLRALGGKCRIAGVDLPPVTLGRFHLLVTVGNSFVAHKRTFQQLAHDLPEALFVLRYGATAMAQFADVFEFLRKIEQYREDAKTIPDALVKILDAEREAQQALLPWRRAVAAFADTCLRLDKGEDIEAACGRLDTLLAASLAGLDMIPDGNDAITEDADGNTPKKKWWTRRRKPCSSRQSAEPAPASQSTQSGGTCQ
jgi:hypothetical protein